MGTALDGHSVSIGAQALKECCGEECYFPLVLHIISILGTWLDQYLGFLAT